MTGCKKCEFKIKDFNLKSYCSLKNREYLNSIIIENNTFPNWCPLKIKIYKENNNVITKKS